MAGFWSEFAEKVGGLAGKWTAYAAFLSFLIYLLGYLTLRFQLSVYGIATNLDILDEKYLFAGSRFLVYAVSSIPNILIIVLPLAAVGCMLCKLLPPSLNGRLCRWVSEWVAPPIRLPLLGMVFALAWVQFVLRKCFGLGNLLLRKVLPDDWLSSVLLASDAKLSLYFSGLVAGALISGVLLLYILRRASPKTGLSEFFVWTLIFLVAVEFLLLPVNYGILVSTQQLPRVAEVSSAEKLPTGTRVWLVWDSKDELTYLVRDANDERLLVSIPRKETRVKIIAYDDIFCELFSASHAGLRPCPR